MGRLSERMARLRAEGRKAFVPFITSGDPSMDVTPALWRALDRAGADVIEVGIPFSDPVADGPVIQRASERALRSGATLAGTLEALGQVELAAGTIIFSYYNPIHSLGLERFAELAAAAGVEGVLVPDLIPEEAGPLLDAIGPAGIDPVLQVAPTTSPERMKMIGERSPALVYAVSLTGVTGARSDLPPGLADFVSEMRANIASPIVVGFGVSTPEQAASVAALADGAVVGSALVRIVEEAGASPDLPSRLEQAARALADAVRGVC